MNYVFNDKKYKHRRQQLRQSLGLPEILLWNLLKNNQLGVKFRRQYGVGPYYIDFYCHEKRLEIELDGETHNNEQSYIHDQKRTEYIKS